MVKDTIEREDLPDDFPGRVVAHLLEKGRKDRLYMRYDEAKERFAQALSAAPEHPETLLEIGRTYDPMGWPTQKEVETLERALAAVPDSMEVHGALEMAYRQPGYRQKHEKAVARCRADRVALRPYSRPRRRYADDPLSFTSVAAHSSGLRPDDAAGPCR